MAAFLRFPALGVCLIKGKRNLSFDIYPAHNTNHLFLIAAILAFWAIPGGQVLQTAMPANAPTSQQGRVDFNLAFGDYTKTAEVKQLF